MASKGKGIATGGGFSGGKRKHDDKSGGGRKRGNPGVLRFFEDVADEADDGDESDFDDDFMEEEFETEPVALNDPGKAHNLPFVPKEEDLDGEEFEKMMEERYRSGSSYVTYAEDNYENKRSVDGNVLPNVKDPIIWKVKCMVGRERHSAFCMMQKFVDFRSLGTKLQIVSAFAVEHIKGFVFIEADKQSDINEACKGICSIYPSRVMPVPNNEVSHLLSPRTKSNGITAGMWARVKNGNYKGDLAQVVFVNDLRKRATVKLIPRIDLQAMAAKFGGGGTRKKRSAPAPRLISSNELEEFRPLIQYRTDRESGMKFEFLDGLMFKDGYVYKKVSIDSLSFWGVMPSEEELLKFTPSENTKNEDEDWLTELYGTTEKKRRTIKIEEGGGKGEGSSGSMGKGEGSSGSMGKGEGTSGSMGKGEGSSGSMGKGEGSSQTMGKGEGSSGSKGKGEGSSGSMGKGEDSSASMRKGKGSSVSSGNGFELYDLVCFGRKDFGLVIGMEKDDSYKILKEGVEGPIVLMVQKRELKNVLSDMKFTALDQHMKAICVSDTVKVLQGPLEGRQGIVKQIYRGTIFLYDENETENGGYFCSKSQMCEKVKLYIDSCKEKDGDSGALGFGDFVSSPKSPLSPKKPWQERDSNFSQGDKDGMFSIGQTVRIRVGPLKGYLCRILAIRRADITVKLDSQQKVLTVTKEHISEVRGKSSNVLIGEDPESSLKPFDLLGSEGGSNDWTNGAGAQPQHSSVARRRLFFFLQPPPPPSATATMIISEKNRREISKYLFQEGVCYAKKDYNLAKHPDIDVPNLQVIKLMQSFKSKEYVRETFAWMHYYWYLTNDGIEFLRTYLNLPSEIVPATLKKQAKPPGRPMGPSGDRPRGPSRFDGERRFGGDRDGYRGGPRAPGGDFGDKGGAPADYRPSFGGPGGRPGFGRGAGGFGAGPASSNQS